MRTVLILALAAGLLFTGCSREGGHQEKPEMLFYIGITMVKPVMELAKNFERDNNCIITILQGGSQDLYDSLKSSRKGDIYLPGSYSYRQHFKNERLLLDEENLKSIESVEFE